jgi:hypothetical protein
MREFVTILPRPTYGPDDRVGGRRADDAGLRDAYCVAHVHFVRDYDGHASLECLNDRNTKVLVQGRQYEDVRRRVRGRFLTTREKARPCRPPFHRTGSDAVSQSALQFRGAAADYDEPQGRYLGYQCVDGGDKELEPLLLIDATQEEYDERVFRDAKPLSKLLAIGSLGGIVLGWKWHNVLGRPCTVRNGAIRLARGREEQASRPLEHLADD